MKICILSDSHDHRALLAQAVAAAKAQGAVAVLHCGDVVAPNTLRGLHEIGLPIHVIHGNNAGDLQAMHRLSADPGGLIHYHGQDASLELGQRKIFMVHYPHYGYAMACTGDWDLVCCGHDHRVLIQRIATVKGAEAWLVNPGSVGGIGGPASYVLGDLSAMTFEAREVPRHASV